MRINKTMATAVWLSAAISCSVVGTAQSSRSTAKVQRSQAIDLIGEGQALEKQGDTQAAYQKYYQSAQLAASPAAYYNLGRLARKAGDMPTAKTWLEQALKMNPKFELAKVELAQVNEGRKGTNREVKSMSQELAGDIAPGSTAAAASDAPMNVDSLRQEVITMQSLAPPDVAAASIDNSADSHKLAGPNFPDAPNPSGTAPSDVPARGAAIPAESITKVNDSKAKILNPGGISSSSDNTDPLLSDTGVDAATETDASGTKAKGSGLPTAEEINKVAFSDESKKLPGSLGYDQDSKVVLGTFAFHREKGDEYRKANRWREAAVEYKTALAISPDPETRSLLAEMLGRLGRKESSGEQFEKAIAQAPQDSTIYYKQGNSYFDDQKYDLAIGSYRRAIEMDPSNKFAINNLGVVYMEKKEYGKAVENFKKVLTIDPNYQMAVLNLGIIYDEDLVDKEQALKYYDRYLALKGPRQTEVQRWADAIRAKPQ
jgi:tetratricopeptide (TPR) repeat protein